MPIVSSWKGNVDTENGVATFNTIDGIKSIDLSSFRDFNVIQTMLDQEYKRGFLNAVDACTIEVSSVKLPRF